jgi:ATP-binding cassette subfamily B protein
VTSLRTFGLAVALVWAAGGMAFVVVVALFAISGLGIVALVFFGNALLGVLVATPGVDDRTIPLVVAALVTAAVVSFASATAAGMHKLLIERTIRYCNETLLRLTIKAPLREFDDPTFHDRLERAERAVQGSPLMVAMAVPQIIGALVSIVGLAAGLFVIHPALVPVTLLASVPLWLAGRIASEEMYSFSFGHTPGDRARHHIGDVAKNRRLAPEVRAYGLGAFLTKRWTDLYDERLAGVKEVVRKHIRRSAIGSTAGMVVLGGVLLVVLWFVQRGDLTLGAAATAAVAVLLLANRSQLAATQLAHVLEHGRYFNDFVELRDWVAGLRTQPALDTRPFRQLRVDNVTFAYPGAKEPALRQVDVAIDAGEVVAIVGQNGSGKTTLVKLLSGLYEPTEGAVTWDGEPVARLAGDGGLDQVGVIFQDFGRYWFSAAENIGIGAPDRIADRRAIQAAAAEAGASTFLERLPQGLDTPLGVEVEGGADLSGGQWQRVAIARVLFRGASFLILDEPTASLDAEAEAALFETLRELRHGRTVVIISHRFSTVRSADRILVMHEGRLVEQGPHEQLMAADGRYARMYRLQSSAYVDVA